MTDALLALLGLVTAAVAAICMAMHIYVCLLEEKILLLVVGVVLSPIGFIHGALILMGELR